MVTNYEGKDIEFKEKLPLLPIRESVVYPFMILPFFVGRQSSIKAVEYSLSNSDRLIFLSSQKDIISEMPEPSEIYNIGTVAMIMRIRKLPDQRIKILIQGLTKAKIINFEQKHPFYITKLKKIEEPEYNKNDNSVYIEMRNTREQLEKLITVGKIISPDILPIAEDIQSPGRLADLVASNFNQHISEAQEILETLDPLERLHKVNKLLNRELEILSVQTKINNFYNTSNNKEHIIREQIKAIKSELGDNENNFNNEYKEMKEKIIQAKMGLEIEKEVLKQLSRLEKMHPDSSESNILMTYIEWMIDLPWNETFIENIDLKKSKEILDTDHYNLEEVKDRIIEFLAVRKLKGSNVRGPIICFSGPPGVGKTSLGKSIAKATGRKFYRISLGGIKDEAEIRGHRRTYVGSMPGKFIQAMKQVKTKYPIILLDEIDKIGSDYKGDPSSALLEVLDSEQNSTFKDHYLNVEFDLSNVMFITTANIIEDIPIPLRDRMEIIKISGYTEEEKVTIAKKHLIPKQIKENGISEKNIKFLDNGIINIIRYYTCEAGLRHLERQIGSVCRKIAIKVSNNSNAKVVIDKKSSEKLLGLAPYIRTEKKEKDEIGIGTGLAWTATGGEILYIESAKMKGKGLIMTGKLGDVMKESAQTAIAYIKSNNYRFNIDSDIFDNNEIHIHFPAIAIPKDGPSAGITIATTIISLLLNKPIRKNIAMTGEITLTGKVLPVGGIKEKVLAALRMGIDTIIIPEKNKKDYLNIPKEYLKNLNCVMINHVEEAFKETIIDWEANKKKKKIKKLSSIAA